MGDVVGYETNEDRFAAALAKCDRENQKLREAVKAALDWLGEPKANKWGPYYQAHAQLVAKLRSALEEDHEKG